MLSSKTTIFQIGNFLLHLAVVITLNHYTEDDTLTSTLQQVLCFVWKRCKYFQAQVLTPCIMVPFLKFTACSFFKRIYSPCTFQFHFLTRPFWCYIFSVWNENCVTRNTYLALTLRNSVLNSATQVKPCRVGLKTGWATRREYSILQALTLFFLYFFFIFILVNHMICVTDEAWGQYWTVLRLGYFDIRNNQGRGNELSHTLFWRE